ncbi:MAG: sigma-54-dependent Fis family transcriptional regulator [Bacteriovoracaceae bacterium]|nr:sigma-54-dependent Fis family transcriptional regulator [Bacteriovoracaceae bacterium]
MHKVLVVEDDIVLQQSVRQALEFHHFSVHTASHGKEALDKIYTEKYDLVVMDVNMPEMDGLQALIEMKKHDSSLIIILMTAYSNVQDAVKAVKEGAYNYLEKPISSDNLVALIKRALKARSLVETTAFSAPTLSLGNQGGETKFVGQSDAMKKVFDLLSKLSKVNTPVLIRGESGTGKELVAKAIHFNGPRKDEKFVTINCGAIPENLIESELFGHEKGAFTGADSRKIGKFQYADGGTLFLDEIGDISASMQIKLLRVLQEKTFTPVGANREITVDVRIIAASHKPFEEMIKSGIFREDLFYRLNVLPVFLPPLRERKSDIPHLINHYVTYFNQLHALSIKGVSPEVEKVMLSYEWPGNIRELRNVIEHAFIMESTDLIQLSSLSANVNKGASKQAEDGERGDENIIDFQDIQNSVIDEELQNDKKDQNIDLKFDFSPQGSQKKMDFQNTKDFFEKEFICQALKVNKGKINQTAINANIPKKTLLRKIEKYGIDPKKFYE